METEFAGAWTPTPEFIQTSNLAWLMEQTGLKDYDALHAWTARHRAAYWELALQRLDVRTAVSYTEILDLCDGVETPRWLPGARMNIVESCFAGAPEATAILSQREGGAIERITLYELETLTNRVACGLVESGFQPGESIAMFMPMTTESVAIYLGIIKAGCVVVGIADSFRPPEIAQRLMLSHAKAVFTQDFAVRGGKSLPLFSSLLEANSPPCIVISAGTASHLVLRAADRKWDEFLSDESVFSAVPCDPMATINILFSSGTTGEPKVIPWSHTTAIKCGADGHFHQNLQPGDVAVWPTNIGWMMGPWLIFSSLMNRAAMGLYQGAPMGRDFGLFLQNTGATMLGVIPSLVKAWRQSDCFAGCDFTGIKVFSSTGECSHAGDMAWLMAQAGGRPVIEYCGGTEIGGAYITGTVTKPCVAGTFNTPALGLDFVLLDEAGEKRDQGEVFLLPPSIGLSTKLLNKDHHAAYFEGAPTGPNGEKLRRHGDQIEALPGGFWRAHGRVDDTMNLGGIKVSSAEIERVIQAVPGIRESAAVAVAPDGGPSLLVIFVVSDSPELPPRDLLQKALRTELNPLFKIHDLIFVETLPRTATNKIMRRVLRDRYILPRL